MLHALPGSVVPAGVTVMLGLCNPPRQGRVILGFYAKTKYSSYA
jgi:hypothetical protein